jgi:hypothetical protein
MQQRGFFSSLFDINFESFVTTRIIKVLYVIAIILAAIYVVFLVAASFASDSTIGALILVLSPVIFLLFVLYTRVLLEFMIVVFRIYENTCALPQLGSPSGGPPATAAQPTPPPAPRGPESP